MFGPWWDWGWLGALLGTLVWIGIIVAAVWLIRQELPNLRISRIPALDLLEERYARGEISREEFLERRAVLLQAARHPEGSQPAEGTTEATQPPAPPMPPDAPEAPGEEEPRTASGSPRGPSDAVLEPEAEKTQPLPRDRPASS